MLADHARELKRDLLVSRAIGNVAGVTLIGIAAMAWWTGSGWWFVVYLAGSALLAAIIAHLSSFTRERQHARDLAWAERLHHLATHDELTGLFNRRQFNVVLEQSVVAARAMPQLDIVLAIVDLDGLKAINDTLGHAAGDVAIRMTAEALTAASPAGSLISRVGGDEFAVLASVLSGGEDDLREQICAAVAQAPFASSSGTHRLTACAGVARFEPAMDGDALFRAADADLYAQKSMATTRTRRVA